MGLINFLLRLFGLKQAPGPSSSSDAANHTASTSTVAEPQEQERSNDLVRPKLDPLKYRPQKAEYEKPDRGFWGTKAAGEPTPPYKFASSDVRTGSFLDLSQDGDQDRLNEFGLPHFFTPEELADWLDVPLGQLAWLTYRFGDERYPHNESDSHYHYHWISKRRGGVRLIEAPKPILKKVQTKILEGILNQVPVHSNAHGFVKGRSIVSNALSHCGERMVLKYDLEDFYLNIRYRQIVAIFRSLGYSREVAIWLTRLTTSRLPYNVKSPSADPTTLIKYCTVHLPQGAPTSPALANLTAFSLDLRLHGLAKSFGANYTRYADDLTFSGNGYLLKNVWMFIPLIEQIIKSCGFKINKKKRKILRNNQRQNVTGVVVNERPNISRKEFDRLKATLHNCAKFGPDSQNHDQLPDFQSHLRGRIAHVKQLNPAKAEKLEELFERVDW